MKKTFATVTLQIEWNEERGVTLVAPWGDKLTITDNDAIDYFFSLKPEKTKINGVIPLIEILNKNVKINPHRLIHAFHETDKCFGIQWDGENESDLMAFAGDNISFNDNPSPDFVSVKTNNGIMKADLGDYIIKDSKANYYVVKI